MARRKKRLGSARHVHAAEEKMSLATAESRLRDAHQALDAVERGDVYSCDQALVDLIEVGRADGDARAEARAQRRGPYTEARNKILKGIDAARRRFHAVCVRPDQKPQR